MMKKLLIIEDDQIVANIYRNKLAVEGFQVEVAYTGETGYDLTQSFRPDAIILDLVLPKMSGVDLMKKIRLLPENQNLPLIIFSNTYLTNMVQEAWKAGATKCLSKANCSPKQVIEAVRSALGIAVEPMAKPATPEPRAKLTAPPAEPEANLALRKSFVATLPDTLTALRNSLKALAKADHEAARAAAALELFNRVRTLSGNANLAGLPIIAQLTEALEALLKELHERPALCNASSLRTLAAAVDFLGFLFDHAAAAAIPPALPANILVVDDEAISRRAVTQALDRAKLKSVGVDDPNAALRLLSENAYDLVFLDVDMPGMNGFELCTKLRALPRYKSTPVVFVTSLTDFESRTNSMMSGGNDFIAKPFHFLELAVKALVYVLRSKLPAPRKV
jgi:DNA-binding response OmpR family regulator